MGRYAYGNQPNILQWNLARLAETLLPLIDADESRAIERATESLRGVSARFERHWLDGFRRKLGLQVSEDGDHALVTDLFEVMHAVAADFTNTYRTLADAAMDDAALHGLSRRGCIDGASGWRANPAASSAVSQRCSARTPPTFRAITASRKSSRPPCRTGDFAPFHALHAVLSRPFEQQPG